MKVTIEIPDFETVGYADHDETGPHTFLSNLETEVKDAVVKQVVKTLQERIKNIEISLDREFSNMVSEMNRKSKELQDKFDDKVNDYINSLKDKM